MALFSRLKGLLSTRQPQSTPVAGADRPPSDPALDPALDPAEVARSAGNAALREGNAAAALAHYERFAAQRPGHAPAHVNCGFALFRLGRLPESEAAYRRARELDPADHETAFFLGQCLAAQGRPVDAEVQYRQTVALRRDFAQGWLALAQVLEQQRRFAEAAPCLRTATQLDNNSAAAWEASARVALHLREPETALLALERWLAIDARAATAWGMRADAMRLARRPAEALQAADAALALDAEDPQLWQARGAALLDLRRFSEAAADFERVLAAQPGAPAAADVLASLGAARCGEGSHEQALEDLDRALAADPDHADALHNRAFALMNLLRFEDAAEFLQRQVLRHRDDARLQFDLAVAWLSQGRWAEGWRQYEWRQRHGRGSMPIAPAAATPAAPAAAAAAGAGAAAWQPGAELHGRRVLLLSEQGLGDAIQFIRYVPEVLARGADVTLQVSPRLLPLLPAPWPGCRLVSDAGDGNGAELRGSLLSLPHLLGVPEPLAMNAPYVRASADRRAHWRQRLGTSGERRGAHGDMQVGLVWAGNPDHPDDARRSITLERLRLALQDLPGLRFVSLQMDVRDSDQPALAAWPALLQIGREQADMADTAALIEQLDLVVSVDTSVAHLAGALGHPLVLLLQRCPDWRWGLCGESTPWYPSVHLLRQPQPGRWDAVLASLRELLQARAAARGA
jgi:tetratricopeptide (TPR) repeat protein